MAAITQKQFYKIIESEQACVDYLKQKGLILHQTEKCAKFRGGVICEGELKESSRKNRKGEIYPCLRCTKRGCRTYISIRSYF